MSLPLLVALCLGLVNLVTYLTWGHDKQAAVAGRRRIPEARLLILCALGGWPAAIFAAYAFRHKTSKLSFIYKVYAVVAVQVGLICLAVVLL